MVIYRTDWKVLKTAVKSLRIFNYSRTFRKDNHCSFLKNNLNNY